MIKRLVSSANKGMLESMPLTMSFMKRMPIVGNHGSDAFLFLLQFCVKSVLNAAMLPYDAGVEKEAEYFKDLVVSSQAAAQRYSFFAERAISRVCYKYGLVATKPVLGFRQSEIQTRLFSYRD